MNNSNPPVPPKADYELILARTAQSLTHEWGSVINWVSASHPNSIAALNAALIVECQPKVPRNSPNFGTAPLRFFRDLPPELRYSLLKLASVAIEQAQYAINKRNYLTLYPPAPAPSTTPTPAPCAEVPTPLQEADKGHPLNGSGHG